MVLLVVDTQKLITVPEIYQFDTFVGNVERLIKASRENNMEVIYVQHDDGPGTELTKGLPEFDIFEKFQPVKQERIFEKRVNSSFKESGLLEYLLSKNEKDVMVVGLQTDYCIDATIKCGFEHGLHMIVPAYCNSTFDNEFMTAEQTYHYYNEFIWKNRYAECITMEEAMERITH